MSSRPPRSHPGARGFAFRILQDIERTNVPSDEAMSRSFATTAIDPRDRGLIVELVFGVLRHRYTLDWRLDKISDRPMERLPLPIRTLLRLGAYQLFYLDRIPVSAAINESVTLAKTVRGRDWSGVVNAILRTLHREPPAPWPDVTKNAVEAYAVRYSSPQWLVQRWLARFNPPQAEHLLQSTLTIPPLTVRTNTLRLTRDSLQTELAKAGFGSQPTAVSPIGLTIEKQGDVTGFPLFHEGAFYIEDEAAQLVPPLLDPQPDDRILDACAAPGGKTTHIAALIQNRGEIIAWDRSATRLRLLKENCRRLGISIVQPMEMDAESTEKVAHFMSKPFDRILVDAPCSGLGVLRRHPEAKWQKEEGILRRQQARQLSILRNVHRLLRPGGVIVYSTCSTEIEENEQIIQRFCSDHPEFVHEPVLPWLPASGHGLVNAGGDYSTMWSLYSMDGFFAARLRKAA